MAWNSEPEIRDLGEYAKKNRYKAVVAICFMGNGKFSVNSYGKTALLCGEAKKVNGQIYDEIMRGEIEIPEELTE